MLFFNNLYSNNGWQIINQLKSSLKIKEIGNDIVFDENVYQELSDDDFDEYNVLNLEEHKRLSSYVTKNIGYKYNSPQIYKAITANFIKKHKIVIIDETFTYQVSHVPLLIFIIERNTKNIHRLGKFETEEQDREMGIDKDIIVVINEILKKEKIKVNSPYMALEICRLALLLDRLEIEEVVFNKISLNSKFRVIENEIRKSVKEKYLNSLNIPMFIVAKKYYLINFNTYNINCNVPCFEHWIFKVNKNGKIVPLEYKLLKEDL